MNQDLAKQHLKVIRGCIKYILNTKEKTASIFSYIDSNENIIIPQSLKYKSEKYTITRILSNSFKYSKNIISIQTATDSKLRTIFKNAFSHSSITRLTIPSDVSLKNGWCNKAFRLTSVTLIPSKHPTLKCHDDQYIVGKSDKKSDIYDVLHFARRDIEEALVPSFVRRVSRCAFSGCFRLRHVSFSPDSELRRIDKNAFLFSPICCLSLPPKLDVLEGGWCNGMANLIEIKITPNNKRFACLNDTFVIEKSDPSGVDFDILCFARRDIKHAVIPSFIEKIAPYAFSSCEHLETVDIARNSSLRVIEKKAFAYSSIRRVFIPLHVVEICEGSFQYCRRLRWIELQDNSELREVKKHAFFSTMHMICEKDLCEIAEIKNGNKNCD